MKGGKEGRKKGRREGRGRENTLEASADGFSNVPKRSLAFLRSTSLTF